MTDTRKFLNWLEIVKSVSASVLHGDKKKLGQGISLFIYFYVTVCNQAEDEARRKLFDTENVPQLLWHQTR
jgi:hypothetical protein